MRGPFAYPEKLGFLTIAPHRKRVCSRRLLYSAQRAVSKLQVAPGTSAAEILDDEAFKLPAGYRARLVAETAKVLEPDSKVWEDQALTLVRYRHYTQASDASLLGFF